MKRLRRHVARCRAADSTARHRVHCCEPLEGRIVLDANEPVVVLVEPVQNESVGDVWDYLWKSPLEFHFNPHVGGEPGPKEEDLDGNGFNDDAYGWNFGTNSPVWAVPNTANGHGTVITNTVLSVLGTERGTLLLIDTKGTERGGTERGGRKGEDGKGDTPTYRYEKTSRSVPILAQTGTLRSPAGGRWAEIARMLHSHRRLHELI